MLGLETIPAVFYFLALFVVPRSPRWLLMHGKEQDAVRVFNKVNPDPEAIQRQIQAVKESLSTGTEKVKHYSMKDLLRPALALVMDHWCCCGNLAANYRDQLGLFLRTDDLRTNRDWNRCCLHPSHSGRSYEPCVHSTSHAHHR